MNKPVAIVGCGPVGMCAALELAHQGVASIIFEASPAGYAGDAKCNSVASRTLEILRRYGIAEEIRAAGLPDDYHTDVIFSTSVQGLEFVRIKMPSRNERAKVNFPPEFLDHDWRTPEPYVRISQLYSNQVILKHIQKNPLIEVRYDSQVLGYTQTSTGITLDIEGSEGQQKYECQYLIGADGGRSKMRQAMGARLNGDAELGYMRSSLIKAPGMNQLFGDRRKAWMNWIVNHKVKGIVVAIDGTDTWLVHRQLPEGVKNFEVLDKHQSILDLLGVDDFEYEIIKHEDWIGRRLVTDKMRDGRAFIAGDAAHLWVPFGGYGMNAGIADGVSVAWLIAAVLNGWADETILDAYEAERLPITEQVSKYAMNSMLDIVDAIGKNKVPASLSSKYNPAGMAIRKVMGNKLYDLNVPQFIPTGLNFGYYYDNSPIISYDDESAPAYNMGSAIDSTVPGCRVPHFWLESGESLYDQLGNGYTLLRFDPSLDVEELLSLAQHHQVPFKLLDTVAPSNDPAYQHRLIIVRQDQHVVWRGNELPKNCLGLIELLTGKTLDTRRG